MSHTRVINFKSLSKPLSAFIGRVNSTNHYARIHSATHTPPNAYSSNSFVFVFVLLLLLAAIILVPLYLTGNLSSGFTSEHYDNKMELFSHQI